MSHFIIYFWSLSILNERLYPKILVNLPEARYERKIKYPEENYFLTKAEAEFYFPYKLVAKKLPHCSKFKL